MSMTAPGGRHARPRSLPDPRPLLAAVAIGVFEFVVAVKATSSARAFVVVLGGVGLTVAAVTWPSVALVAVFPGSFLTARLGLGPNGMSIADALTYLGTLAALPTVPWHARAFQRILYVALAYSVLVTVAALAHPTTAGMIEVVHRFFMVVGTVCIGAAVVYRGKVTLALRALVVAALIVSVRAIVDTLTHGLEPAYAFGIQKNAAGTLLVTTILCVYFGRRYLRWPSWLIVTAGLVLIAGLAATQSRGSGVALGAAALVFMIRSAWVRQNRRVLRVLPLVLLLGSGLAVAMVTSYQHEVAQHAGVNYEFGSAGTRKVTYTTAWDDVIVPNLVVGAGPKWFFRADAPAGEPHNLVLDELSSDGILGFVGFVALLWICLSVARRAPPPLGEMAFYVLVARIVSDLFDLFWVAGPNTLPFLVLGLAVGAASIAEERGAVPLAGDRAQRVGVV